MVNDVFAPADLGPVRLRNRTVKAATFEGRTPHGLVTDELIDYHLAPARGGVGLTTVAYLAVAPEGRTQKEVIVVNDESAPGLARLTEAIHESLGAPRESIRVLITEVPSTHWGIAGQTAKALGR